VGGEEEAGDANFTALTLMTLETHEHPISIHVMSSSAFILHTKAVKRMESMKRRIERKTRGGGYTCSRGWRRINKFPVGFHSADLGLVMLSSSQLLLYWEREGEGEA